MTKWACSNLCSSLCARSAQLCTTVKWLQLYQWQPVSSINQSVHLTNCGRLIAVLLGFPVGLPTELHIAIDPHRWPPRPASASICWLSSFFFFVIFRPPLKQRKNVSGLRGHYRQILPLPLQLHLFRKYSPLLYVIVDILTSFSGECRRRLMSLFGERIRSAVLFSLNFHLRGSWASSKQLPAYCWSIRAIYTLVSAGII